MFDSRPYYYLTGRFGVTPTMTTNNVIHPWRLIFCVLHYRDSICCTCHTLLIVSIVAMTLLLDCHEWLPLMIAIIDCYYCCYWHVWLSGSIELDSRFTKEIRKRRTWSQQNHHHWIRLGGTWCDVVCVVCRSYTYSSHSHPHPLNQTFNQCYPHTLTHLNIS